MIKYNARMLRLLEAILEAQDLHTKFRAMVEAHIMDASIFMQCVCLTIERQVHGGSFLMARFTLQENMPPAEGEAEATEATEATEVTEATEATEATEVTEATEAT